MIEYFNGTVFNTNADTIVNTINCVGVMSAGIALEYALRYPAMFEEYKTQCEKNNIKVGYMHYYQSDDKLIVNFPTKWHFKYPSQLQWIEQGLQNFVTTYSNYNIKSIAFPKLGTNNGHLPWDKVKTIMEKYLSPLPIKVYICLDTNQHAEGIEKDMLDYFHTINLDNIKKELRLTQKQVDTIKTFSPFNRFWKIKELEGISSGTYGKIFTYCYNHITNNNTTPTQLTLF